jgi:2-dehydro-3-deoxygluconokinase
VSEHRLAGVTRVDYHRRGSAGSTLAPDDLRAAWDPPPRAVHVTGLTMALGSGPAQAVVAAVRTARERGVAVCLDVNHRDRLWTSTTARTSLQDLAGFLDVVIASDDELPLLAPAGARREDQLATLLEAGVREVVLKRGAAGASAHTADTTVEVPAIPVTAVDPIGAGDAFVAGYLSGVLDGLSVADRLARANTAGAFAAATIGDWEGLPHRHELGLLGLQSGTVVR